MKKFLLIVNLLFSSYLMAQFQDEWIIGPFMKCFENPIIKPDSAFTFFCPKKKQIVQWQKADVFNPAAIVKDNKVYLFTRCEDNKDAGLGLRTSRIGLAESNDGVHFKTFKEPVLYPDSGQYMQYDYPGGCEDPRVVETEEGLYVMTYTSWNNKKPRLSIAFSKDLFHWEKKGPAFTIAYNGNFLNKSTKSGSIITRIKDGKPVVAKIKRKYWMYWGEKFINLAWSDNLIDWYPTIDEKGELKKIISPRIGKFDSRLTECGPPALLTNKGILLIYNGENATDSTASPLLPKGT